MSQFSPIQPIQPIERLSSLDSQVSAVGQSGTVSGLPFAGILQQAISDMQETTAASNQAAYDLAVGNVDDPSQVMITSAKATTAIEFATQLSSRVVSAYKEIMQMQV